MPRSWQVVGCFTDPRSIVRRAWTHGVGIWVKPATTLKRWLLGQANAPGDIKSSRNPKDTLRFWGSKHYQTARTQRWRHEGTTLHCPSCPACHTFRPCRAHRDHALAYIETLSSRCTSNPSWIPCNEDHNRWYSWMYAGCMLDVHPKKDGFAWFCHMFTSVCCWLTGSPTFSQAQT